MNSLKPGLHENFFGTAPVWTRARCPGFAARHPPSLPRKWKNSSHEYPKTYGGQDYLSTWSHVLGHSRHESLHPHDKNGGCQAANSRHRGQIQTGTVPKRLWCKLAFIIRYRHLSTPHKSIVSISKMILKIETLFWKNEVTFSDEV